MSLMQFIYLTELILNNLPLGPVAQRVQYLSLGVHVCNVCEVDWMSAELLGPHPGQDSCIEN